jgi:hypothetical protein
LEKAVSLIPDGLLLSAMAPGFARELFFRCEKINSPFIRHVVKIYVALVFWGTPAQLIKDSAGPLFSQQGMPHGEK